VTTADARVFVCPVSKVLNPICMTRLVPELRNALIRAAGGPKHRIAISQALTAGGRATVGNPRDLL